MTVASLIDSAKEIRLAPISSQAASEVIRRHHYSGKVVNNSQLHFGVFAKGVLLGALQFGPSLDKKKLIGLVSNTAWNGFIELNRMALSPLLPRNSESRALAVAMRMFRKHYPFIEWVVSFSDATSSGDGTIYRASGFVLTGIKLNKTIWELPGVGRFSDVGVRTGGDLRKRISRVTETTACGGTSMKAICEAGGAPVPGYQLRYVYFLNKAARDRLTVSTIPFSKIDEMGAGMYLGVAGTRRGAASHADAGGSTPTGPLHSAA